MAQAIIYCIKPEITVERRIISLDPNKRVRLGRAHKNETPEVKNGLFLLDKPYVSYDHAYLIFDNNEFFLQDNSTNGTFVNGNQIEKGRPISIMTGDVVQLGKDKINAIDNLPVVVFYIHLFLGKENLSNVMEDYPDPLNLYERFPTFPLNLEYLYNYTLRRFEILQHLNKFGEVELTRKSGIRPMVSDLNFDLKFFNLITRQPKTAEEEYFIRKCDEASHFILRIACCRNFPLRRWLIKQEVKLMYIKWFYLNEFEKLKILFSEGFHYPKTDDLEKKDLAESTEGFLNPELTYFKVPFSEGSNLLRNKSVIIKEGIVFVNIDDMIAPIMTQLDETMDRTMKNIKTRLHNVWDDKRIVSIIKYVERNIHFDRYSVSRTGAKVLPMHIDTLSTQSFPLCMQVLHNQLKQVHHLRNGGRFQYSLFLKGIGLSLPNALIFWRHHFTKRIPIDEFMKEYSYHIKHVYGVVGKMADYPPQNCDDILKRLPGPLDYHGCPFKVLDKTRLNNVLKAHNVNKIARQAIVAIADEGMPQMACGKYFDATHATSTTAATKHPNVYYESSRKIRIAYENTEQENNQSCPKGNNHDGQNDCPCTSKSLGW